VMVEQHVRGQRAVPNPIGLGAYGVDIHAMRRILINGQPQNEGSNGVAVPKPYSIGYGAIVPKAAECENLFATFALSASHVAFGSIRMEPVFMILSQSAATAAAMAIDEKIAVQKVDYARLRARLNAARVMVEWDESRAVKGIGGDNRPKSE
jgi:hypothetical protein